MRILYGVTGCGLGHSMRARALAQRLVASGHRVRMAASGRAVDVLARHGLEVTSIDGMCMRYGEGEVRRARTLVDLVRGAPRAVAHNARVAWREIVDFDPQIVVTDFDTFANVLGRVLGVPVVSIDHQHVVDRFRHPRRITERVSSFAMARAIVSAKTPRCAHYIVTSFFFPEPCRGSTTLVGPIVRPEIARAAPTRGDHVLVYQTTAGDPRVVRTLGAVRGVRFVVYGLGREETVGNVELRAFDEKRFVSELASARAVIANGGFTTLSEAIYLGKPVLSVPLRRQSEQELNAAYVDALGVGLSAPRIDPETVARFLERDFVRVDDARIRAGTEDAHRALDRALAEAA